MSIFRLTLLGSRVSLGITGGLLGLWRAGRPVGMFRLMGLLGWVAAVCALSACVDAIDVPLYTQTDRADALPSNGIAVIEITTRDGQGITDRSTWKEASITVHTPDATPAATMAEAVHIKGRGNSTFKYPKKAFTLKFDRKMPLLGLPKGKKWVFLANYRDPTLLRNDFTYFIARMTEGLEWTPRGEYADIVFNGNYVGNYYVCEKIDVDAQRVAIDKLKADDADVTGGYLLQFDRTYDEPNKFKTLRLKVPVGLKAPDDDDCQPQHVDYIERYVNEVESLLVKHDFAALYDRYIDLPSFVDFLLVQVISGNNDYASPRSVYVYKKRGGKLYAGPVWDFDFSTYYREERPFSSSAWWYKYLLEDSLFRQTLKEHWQRLRPRLETEALDYLAARRRLIFQSALMNFQTFPYDMSLNKGSLADCGFLYCYEMMVSVYRRHLQYLDTYINAL